MEISLKGNVERAKFWLKNRSAALVSLKGNLMTNAGTQGLSNSLEGNAKKANKCSRVDENIGRICLRDRPALKGNWALKGGFACLVPVWRPLMEIVFLRAAP